MTIEMVKNVLERCAAREEALLEFMPEGSWSIGYSEGQAMGYRWALRLLSQVEDPLEAVRRNCEAFGPLDDR